MQELHSSGQFVIVLSVQLVLARFNATRRCLREKPEGCCYVNSVFAMSKVIPKMCFHLPICAFTLDCTSQKAPQASVKVEPMGFFVFFNFGTTITLF